MNAVRTWMRTATIAVALATGGAVAAQDGALPLVPALPLPVDDGDDSPNWRDQVEADREAKGWGPPRGSNQNWAERYTGGPRTYESRWDSLRPPRIRPARSGGRYADQRLQSMEAQAQTYQQLYWMMKAQIEAEQNGR